MSLTTWGNCVHLLQGLLHVLMWAARCSTNSGPLAQVARNTRISSAGRKEAVSATQ